LLSSGPAENLRLANKHRTLLKWNGWWTHLRISREATADVYTLYSFPPVNGTLKLNCWFTALCGTTGAERFFSNLELFH
jgi:hypothetical protein